MGTRKKTQDEHWNPACIKLNICTRRTFSPLGLTKIEHVKYVFFSAGWVRIEWEDSGFSVHSFHLDTMHVSMFDAFPVEIAFMPHLCPVVFAHGPPRTLAHPCVSLLCSLPFVLRKPPHIKSKTLLWIPLAVRSASAVACLSSFLSQFYGVCSHP